MANDDILNIKRGDLVMFAALIWRTTHDSTVDEYDETTFLRARTSDMAIRSWLADHPEITAYPDSFVDMLPEYGNRLARQIMRKTNR